MPNLGERAVRTDEKNNFKEGREGSGTMKHDGPAAGMKKGNPTSGGGINRATKG